MSWPATILLGLVVGLIAAAAVRGGTPDDGSALPNTGDPESGSETAPAADTPPDPSADPAADDEPRGSDPDATVVTLTFDDGPHPTQTEQILKILREHEVRAVFCVVGEQVRAHPELVRKIVEGGHVLCNHTDTHDLRLDQRDDARIEREIRRTADAIEDALPDAEVPYFRQPAMSVTANVEAVARTFDYRSLDWNLDPRDWSQPGADAVVSRVLGDLKPGAVVLLHDGGGDRSGTVAALPTLLEALDTAGYKVVLPEGA